ncbi:MAG TPA: hypothetical protein VKM56_07745 [Verrucomicrobiae bacterium]|nr:hypothetical protein [Verrucomicrobiae bacterium]
MNRRWPLCRLTTRLNIIAILLLLCVAIASEVRPAENEPASEAPKPKPDQDQLEATFKTTLTKATLSGRWCSVLPDGKKSEGRLKLSPEKEDKYTIVGVSKLKGDSWLIRARIQYGKVDVVAPIPIEVKWAGDTPVIVVDKMTMPGGGTYSARVMIYENTYAGTWSGGDHGGLLNGVINHEKDSDKE